MSKQISEYEVSVHRLGPGPECAIVLQRSENLDQMTQYALQVFASSIVKLVTVAEVIDGTFIENKVSLCR